MSLIYEPKGRAREYSPLACNLANFCEFGCKYCYAPRTLRKTTEEWSKPGSFKNDVISRFTKDAAKLINDPRDILFSFASDPYMNEESAALMKQVLPVAEQCKLRVQVLTKNPSRAIETSGSILARNKWKLGVTLIFLSEKLREEWEPGATPISDRIEALHAARSMGIPTWVSIEPVVDIEDALRALRVVAPIADFLKVGKLNHFAGEADMDWAYFLREARAIIGDRPHLIKDDLLKFDHIPGGQP